VQLHLGVLFARILVKHAVGLDEHDALLLAAHDPQDEVRIEATLLEEADAGPPAQVAQEVYLAPGQRFVLFLAPVVF
jgi:hypothetical protein